MVTSKHIYTLVVALILFSRIVAGQASKRDIFSFKYDAQYHNIGRKSPQKTAVIVVGYNRPDYFKKCLKSLEKNAESQSLVFIFAIDGGPENRQAEYQKIIQESLIKKSILLFRPYNYGCPKNHIDSKRFAFDWCGFERIVVVEEDVLVTPYYFHFLLNLHDWATKKYDNIGCVQGWSYCYLSKKKKHKFLEAVVENERQFSFVTYCMDKKAWDTIKDFLYTYESFIDEIPLTSEYTKARSKPKYWTGIARIKDFIFNEVRKKEKAPALPDSKFLLKSRYIERCKKLYSYNLISANQDQVLGISLFLNNLIKLQSVVNRCIHIGVHGITTNQQTFIKHGYSDIHLDFFKEDAFIRNFKLFH